MKAFFIDRAYKGNLPCFRNDIPLSIESLKSKESGKAIAEAIDLKNKAGNPSARGFGTFRRKVK